MFRLVPGTVCGGCLGDLWGVFGGCFCKDLFPYVSFIVPLCLPCFYSPTALLKGSQFGKVRTGLVGSCPDLRRPWPAMPGCVILFVPLFVHCCFFVCFFVFRCCLFVCVLCCALYFMFVLSLLCYLLVLCENVGVIFVLWTFTLRSLAYGLYCKTIRYLS